MEFRTMLSWLSDSYQSRQKKRPRSAAKRRREPTFQPAVNQLEDRVTPTTLPLNFLVNTLSPTSATATATSGGIADAIAVANADTTDTVVSITFDSTVFTGVSRTIQLTKGLSLNPTNTSLSVTIDATSVGGVTINGGGVSTDLSVTAGTTNVTDLTLTNGFASNSGIGNGGGIYNTATLTLTNSTISGNDANGAGLGGGGGGGIFNTGTLTVLDSTISGNTAFGSGNGANGGGIQNLGTLTLTNSTVANNASANAGGGIYSGDGSHAALVNDTITGNGILSFGSGAGIFNGSGNAMSLTNTIVAGNAANGDLAAASDGSNFTGSFDIIGDNSSLSNLTNSQNSQYPANLPLAPLNYYGGPTETVALLGTPFVGTSTGVPTTDQRGFAHGASVDIGAYQSQTTAVDFLVTSANDPGLPGMMSLRGAIDLANLQTTSVAITFAATYDIQITVPTTLDLANPNFGVTITIDATSVSGATINGGGASSSFSVFEVDNGTVGITDLTISNGNTGSSGGGLYNNSILTLTNCTFTNNSAGNDGGGFDNEGTLTVTNCTLSNNTANYGGGFYNDATLLMTGTTVSGNSLTGIGGGAGIGNDGEATISGSTISNNTGNGAGDVGGGILNYSLLTFTNDTISGNSADTSGGGIEDEGTSLSVMNCAISGNTSLNGGGVYSTATTTITSSQITGNSSNGTGGGISDSEGSTVSVGDTTIGNNSAVGNGGGINNNGTLTITNSTLSNNISAADGGGIAHVGGTTTILDSTLSGNSDGGGGGLGGGIAALSSGVFVFDSTLSGNSAAVSGGGIYMSSPVQLIDTIVANSLNGGDLAGGMVEKGSVNNLIDDAATGSNLTDGVGGNIIDHSALLSALGSFGGPTQTFKLLTGSPAINAGTPLTVATLGGAVAIGDTTLTVISSSQLGIGAYVAIDSEVMLVTGITSSTSVTVSRGQLGTTAAAHNNESLVILATDQRGILRSVTTPSIGAFEVSSPTIVSVSPNTGPSAGGTTVTLTGTQFLSGATVTVGGVAATNVVVVNGTTITFTTPRGVGRVDIVETNPDGGTVTDEASFTFAAPPAIVAVGSGPGGPPEVWVYNSVGTLIFNFMAYNTSFTGGVNVAVADVNGDGVPDIITGAGPGGGPHVKVFDGVTGNQIASFYAFAPTFSGGVSVAGGDVNGDGFADVVIGAGAGGASLVKVVDGTKLALVAPGGEILDSSLIRSFNAYDPGFGGSVNVAVGDTNGDGKADVITGAGPGGGPNVKVYDGATGSLLLNFFAYPSTFTGGVYVAAGDVNGDGKADIIVGAGAGNGPNVSVFNGVNGGLLDSFLAYASTFGGSVRVASGDINGDGFADIITGAGPGGGPHVKVFDGSNINNPLESFMVENPGFTGGVFVG